MNDEARAEAVNEFRRRIHDMAFSMTRQDPRITEEQAREIRRSANQIAAVMNGATMLEALGVK